MRIAAIYDIHGNLPALDAVLGEIARLGVDEIVVGGDVFPGPLARDCLTRLEGLPVPVRFIRGNGDREVSALARGRRVESVPEIYLPQMQWVADQLGSDQLERIEAWPLASRVSLPGLGEVLFCHATPRSDTEIFVRTTKESKLVKLFAEAEAQLVVCGHTHMPFDRRIGSVRVVNAGSVGMPFGAPGAYWLLLGDSVDLRHTEYDPEQAAEVLRACDYPQVVEFIERSVLEPPSEADMLHLFSQAELAG